MAEAWQSTPIFKERKYSHENQDRRQGGADL
jgi:hypothetical protein